MHHKRTDGPVRPQTIGIGTSGEPSAQLPVGSEETVLARQIVRRQDAKSTKESR